MGPYQSDEYFAMTVLCIAGIFLVATLVLEFISERRDK